MANSDSDQTLSPVKSRDEASFETPFFKGRVSGSNLNLFLTFFTFMLVFGLAAWVWIHREDASQAQATVVRAIDKSTEMHVKLVQTMKENTCLLSLPQEKREAEFLSPNSLCKRLSQ